MQQRGKFDQLLIQLYSIKVSLFVLTNHNNVSGFCIYLLRVFVRSVKVPIINARVSNFLDTHLTFINTLQYYNTIFVNDRLTSLPRGRPEPRVAVTPTTFAINVLRVRNSFKATPLRMVFISGIPEPINQNIDRYKVLPANNLHIKTNQLIEARLSVRIQRQMLSS